MIKVGIYGPSEADSPLRKQLLRLLLRHPDVDLRTVAAENASGVPLAELYRVYTGETELRLERRLDLDGLDVLFVIGEDNLPAAAMDKLRGDADFRLIVLGKADGLLSDLPEGMEYGFNEYNRKAMVRGARAAVSPRPVALAIESALFPLAKQHMLEGDIHIRAGAPDADPALLEASAAEARTLLQHVQPSFAGSLKIEPAPIPPYKRIDLELTMPLPAPMDRIEEVYAEAYEDHNFVYTVGGTEPVNEDLRGSNKCLLQLLRRDGNLRINATMDHLTRGAAGNAVHIMNLLFGLHERTGLSI